MILFTPDQIQKFKDIIEKKMLFFIAKNVGSGGLTNEEKAIVTYEPNTIISEAFKYGMWSINSKDNISLYDFQKILTSKKFLPLTEKEKAILNEIEIDTTAKIKDLSNKVISKLGFSISEINKRKQLQFEKILGEKAKEAILKRQSVKEFASELYHNCKDTSRDLIRVSHYVLHSCANYGKLNEIKRVSGDDAILYFYVYPQACKHCIKEYLTNGYGSQPKEFTISELVNNGTNIGRKAKDYKPTISSLHPYCRCELKSRESYEVWNKEKKDYEIKKVSKESLKQSIYETEQRILKKRRERGEPQIIKSITNELMTFTDKEIIPSQYKAVNEYETLFKKNLAIAIGNSLDEIIKKATF